MTKSNKTGAQAVHILGAALALGMSLGMVPTAAAAGENYLKLEGVSSHKDQTTIKVEGTNAYKEHMAIKLHGTNTVKGQNTIKVQGFTDHKIGGTISQKGTSPQ